LTKELWEKNFFLKLFIAVCFVNFTIFPLLIFFPITHIDSAPRMAVVESTHPLPRQLMEAAQLVGLQRRICESGKIEYWHFLGGKSLKI
jgi:hypothetical protein